MRLKNEVDKYLNYCFHINRLDEKSIKAYKTDLYQYLQIISHDYYDCKIEVLKYIEYISNRNYAPKTIRRKIASVKAFYNYLFYEDIISENPFNKIKIKIREPKVLPSIIPNDILKKLLENLYLEQSKHINSPIRYREICRDILIVELLIGTGIRISELCNIKLEHVNLANHYLQIWGKGKRERIIPVFHPSLLKAFHNYLEEYSDFLTTSDYLFTNRKNSRLSTQSVRNMIKKYTSSLHIEQIITPHMFRHTFATMLLSSEVDIRYIQQLLGHSSILTTQIYTHIISTKQNEIMRTKNPRASFPSF